MKISKKADDVLRLIQIFFYLAFVILWFKDNFAPLKKIKLNPWIFLLLFLIIFSARLLMKLRTFRFRLPSLSRQKLLAIALIVSVGLLLRLPYLFNYKGLLTSDEALFCLEAKHIAEGGVPPICAYGQLYIGTLPSHFFALIFKLFGYSVFAFKFVTLLLYLGFIIFHFFFMLTIFPFTFSLFVSILYCLPFGNLVQISLDGSFIYPFLLLLGMSLIYLAYVIAYKKTEKYFSWLGFLIGLSFWVHQMMIYFILLALFLIFFQYRLAIKKYLIIFIYALIGFFPQLLLEAFHQFHLVKFLTAGKTIINWEKIKKTLFLISSLLTFSEHPSRIIFVFLILAGFIALLWWGFKTKQFLAIKVYNLYFIIFMVVYLLSGHSNRYLFRYLFPLSFCVPVLFLAGFILIKGKLRYILISLLCLLTLTFYNWQGQKSYYLALKEYHNSLNRVLTFLENTNIKYWKADFWTSYLLTALSGEKVVVATTYLSRYYQYELLYYNHNEKENFIFTLTRTSEREQARSLLSVIETFQIPFKKDKVGEFLLIYDIESPIILFDLGPLVRPAISDPEIEIDDGFLVLTYKILKSSEEDLLFWMNVEIPYFSKISLRFSLKDKEVKVRIPFPEANSFTIIYYLDYWGTKILSSYREIQFQLPPSRIGNRTRPEIVYLDGFNVVGYKGQRMRVCQKESKIELNRSPLPREKVNLILHSPFDFSHMFWYGHLVQEVEILVNDHLVAKSPLKDGKNHLQIGYEEAPWKERGNIILLRFKFHFRFKFGPRWKASALLERIYIE